MLVGTFCRPPKRTVFETFLGISGLESLETPVNCRSGHKVSPRLTPPRGVAVGNPLFGVGAEIWAGDERRKFQLWSPAIH